MRVGEGLHRVHAYGEYEQAPAWLACIDEMFGRFDRIIPYTSGAQSACERVALIPQFRSRN